MGTVIESIELVYKSILMGIIEFCLSIMYKDVNQGIDIVSQITQTGPTTNFPEILAMLEALSDHVLMPIAGVILSFVLTYELIQMVMERNNLHDLGSFVLFKYLGKASICVFLLTKCKEITKAIFEVGIYITDQAASVIVAEADINISDTMLEVYHNQLENMSISELAFVVQDVMLAVFVFKVIAILIAVIAIGRLVEGYLMISVAPIAFATLGNKEWGHIGINYIKGLMALAFQGFFIMVCVAIYAALVASTPITDDLDGTIFATLILGFVLCFTLFKTSSLSKQIFTVH